MVANWPAPSHIGAITTTRLHGVSSTPYDKHNLALHVGDDEKTVLKNRQMLQQTLTLPGEPAWLEQTHTNRCVVVEDDTNRHADAAVTRDREQVLAIMTADCLPILLCDKKGIEIAAIHSGWRGLANGIIENTLAKMQSKPCDLIAWIGPAICQQCYEVGDDVLNGFTKTYTFAYKGFRSHGAKQLANLPFLAELVLNSQDISSVYQSNECTFENEKNFYSYRRQAKTGRMTTLIWFKQDSI